MKNLISVFSILLLSTQVLAASAADCVGEVKNLVPSISDKQIATLCRGAQDATPAKCLYDMKSKMVFATIDFGVDICRPVLCQVK